MEIPAKHMKLKVHSEVVVYKVQASGSSDGTLGCFHVNSGQLAERLLPSSADPADLQVSRVTPAPLSVVLREPDGHEVTLDVAPTADRRLAVTTALVAALARATLKAERAEAAAAAAVAALPTGPPLVPSVRTSRRPVKRPPGRSIVNPSARKRPTASGISFDSDSQE
ncbi:uncharacterized protein LOC122386792 [Amphibalanus amphitrite]|uniref:uncharacterized protein LOC122386792 n=1 Tax=Amphibalanus amphitrite TaxID=1232801 RepID=UPI001C8FF8D8|nr:uncharacterized protein LOC122386792 [Amphibalanus amphitrite]XP_043232314.1 uncharacterized protein LOC122386792 [Amphibalanus amphitrite]XP_043232315.1 uncharacterized protein LOC122386792 [Amphibalanus amphitrite]XP_043232316.1 uncharacterized protein LOC122386792 [Amphibalanus amphitrite]XP_043232317.1 uncharacterized protein LOC122386792 [Amphibalanus amphitrite]